MLFDSDTKFLHSLTIVSFLFVFSARYSSTSVAISSLVRFLLGIGSVMAFGRSSFDKFSETEDADVDVDVKLEEDLCSASVS